LRKYINSRTRVYYRRRLSIWAQAFLQQFKPCRSVQHLYKRNKCGYPVILIARTRELRPYLSSFISFGLSVHSDISLQGGAVETTNPTQKPRVISLSLTQLLSLKLSTNMNIVVFSDFSVTLRKMDSVHPRYSIVFTSLSETITGAVCSVSFRVIGVYGWPWPLLPMDDSSPSVSTTKWLCDRSPQKYFVDCDDYCRAAVIQVHC